MRIEFNIFENNTKWSALTHQINSDILLRNVLVKGQVSDLDLEFSYNENTQEGTICNTNNQVIGDFFVDFS